MQGLKDFEAVLSVTTDDKKLFVDVKGGSKIDNTESMKLDALEDYGIKLNKMNDGIDYITGFIYLYRGMWMLKFSNKSNAVRLDSLI